MRVLAIIPARFASTRFPGKPLANLVGKPMIQHVYERVQQARHVADVLVATDDPRIEACVKGFGGSVAMTASDHPSGTDRCREASDAWGTAHEVVLNVQGDEPLIHPDQVDAVATLFRDPEVQIGTLARPFDALEDLLNPNTAKIVLDQAKNARYFSRSPIPFLRDIPQAAWLAHHQFLQHVGIYGYRRETLGEITRLQRGQLEQAESLEQLRWLEHGYAVRVGLTQHASHGVDTPEDLARLEAGWPG